MDFSAKINEYNEKFKAAQDLEKGLGSAIADFITAHEPIRAALARDLAVIDAKFRALEAHKDQRMVSVAVTILNVLAQEDDGMGRLEFLLTQVKSALGDDVFQKLVTSPRAKFHAP